MAKKVDTSKMSDAEHVYDQIYRMIARILANKEDIFFDFPDFG